MGAPGAAHDSGGPGPRGGAVAGSGSVDRCRFLPIVGRHKELPAPIRYSLNIPDRWEVLLFQRGDRMAQKRMWTRIFSLAALVVLTLVSVATGQTGMNQLVAAAKQEGQLTVIALPHDWCGYGEVINGFRQKYGLKVNELNPDAGSGDEVEAIKANKGNMGPQAPDVIDVGLSFGPSAKKDGLLQPYKVSTWSTIPNDAKDAEGYWYGDYHGVLAFQINADLVTIFPRDWPDLLKPEYKNAVALAGDPRASNQAIQGVLAAGQAAAKGDAGLAAAAC